MSHLIDKVGELAAHGVGFRSLTEQIDTTTSGSMLVFNIFGSLAQLEHDLIRERTNSGLKAARERGSLGGRHPVIPPDKLQGARSYRGRADCPRGCHPPQGWQNRALQGARRCCRLKPHSKREERVIHERNPNIVTSSLSGVVTEQGVTVRVNIIRLENEPGWSLEGKNENGTSTVWNDLFATNDAAHAAFRQAVDEEGMHAFLDQAAVIPFPH